MIYRYLCIYRIKVIILLFPHTANLFTTYLKFYSLEFTFPFTRSRQPPCFPTKLEDICLPKVCYEKAALLLFHYDTDFNADQSTVMHICELHFFENSNHLDFNFEPPTFYCIVYYYMYKKS